MWWLAKEEERKSGETQGVGKHMVRKAGRELAKCHFHFRSFSFLYTPTHTHARANTPPLNLVCPHLQAIERAILRFLTTGPPETTCNIYVFPHLPDVPSASISSCYMFCLLRMPFLTLLPTSTFHTSWLFLFFQESA